MDNNKNVLFSTEELAYLKILLSKELSNLYRRFSSCQEDVVRDFDNEFRKKNLEFVTYNLNNCNSILSKINEKEN